MEKVIFNILLIFLFLVSVITFVSLFFINAPYGRFTRKGWGLRINPKIAWLVMEFPAFFVILFCFIIGNKKTSIVAVIFLSIWMIHYFQRTFIFSLLIRTKKNTFPVLLMLFSILFNVLNGYLNGRYLFYFAPVYDVSWFADPRFVTGVIIFIMGFVINVNSDFVLRNLRKPNEKNSSYKIPSGGLFKYVSSPNYLGEIIEWIGWTVATWSIAGLAFAVFTMANLVPRAVSNHNWYLKNFPEYPKKRKALIPFIF